MREIQTDDVRPEQRLRVLGILSVLMGFASISTDLYLPAMPAMGRELGASAGAVAYTVSGYLVGFSLGQLAWGPIGDRYGRRAPIAIGLVLFLAGSAGCALASDVRAVIFWRVIQALGACASVVLARAMVRDLYRGARAAHMMSTLLTVMSIAPLLGPFVGGEIFAYAGWRAIFWTLVGIGVLTLVALFKLPETLPNARRNGDPLLRAFAQYGQLLRDRKLLSFALAGGFFYAGMFAYIAGTPFAYITYYHVPPQAYGALFAIGIAGIMLANLCNARLMARFGSERLLCMGTSGAAVAALAVAADARTSFGGLAGLVVPLFFFIASMGFIVANAIASALERYPTRSGVASALIGSMQYGSGVVGSALVGAFSDGTPWPMACVIALCGVGSFLSTLALRPQRIAAEPVPESA